MPKFVEASNFELSSLDEVNLFINKEDRSLLNEESTSPTKIKLSFTHEGVTHEKILEREGGAIKEGVEITLGESGEKMKAKEVFSYHSQDRNMVLVFTEAGKFEGLLFADDSSQITHFVGESGKLLLDSNVNDYLPEALKRRKLTSEVSGIVYWDNCHSGQNSAGTRMTGLDMGMAIGNIMFRTQGSSKSIDLLNKFVTLANAVYERQMDLSLRIADVYIATSPTSFAPSSCSQDMSTQLTNFRNWRSRPSSQPLWHLFDDCFGAFGNTLGIAYLSTLCTSSTSNVGVTQYFDYLYDEDEYQTWATFTHEVGHNLAAQHSFEEGQRNTGGIMDYGTIKSKEINGVTQFNTEYRKREVCSKLNYGTSSGCLDIGVFSRTLPENEFRKFAPVRDFTPVDRTLNCVKHSRREPNLSRPLSTFMDKSRLQCQKACAEDPECAGFVSGEERWCQLVTSENSNTLQYSPKLDTYLCSEGKLRESLKELTIDDMLDLVDTAKSKGECCEEQEDAFYQGLNYHFLDQTTEEECKATCVRDSNCEAASFDKSINECFFYGGPDFTRRTAFATAITSMKCDRTCLSDIARVDESALTNSSSGYRVLAGGVLFVGAVVATVAFSKLFFLKKTQAPTF